MSAQDDGRDRGGGRGGRGGGPSTAVPGSTYRGSSFDAWALPGWASVERTEAVARSGADLEVRYPAADPRWMARLAAGLVEAPVSDPMKGGRATMLGRPAILDRAEAPGRPAMLDRATMLDRAAALGRAGARFLDPDDPLRRSALSLLPGTAGLSAPMAEEVLDGMAADWTVERLGRLLREELGDDLGEGWPIVRGRRSRPVAPRLCVQLVAGSVPGVGVTALIRSLLIGAPTLLKPGLGDVVLPVLFAHALRDVSPRLADELAVVYWPGGSEEVERAALREAEVSVVYGSDATVAGIRARTPPTTRLVTYHHREGVGVIGSGVLGSTGAAASTAEDVAWAVSLFDQRGCVSPGVIFVEAPGVEPADGAEPAERADGVEPAERDEASRGATVTPRAFARLLAAALARLEERLPSGALDGAERATLQQLRGTAELLGAAGRVTLEHGDVHPWTVVYDPESRLDHACVGRSVIVRPFRTPADLMRRLAPWAPHLQTVGVAGLGERLGPLASELGRLGASRVTPFRGVPFPPPWWHHDGRGPLLDLVRWVDLEGG